MRINSNMIAGIMVVLSGIFMIMTIIYVGHSEKYTTTDVADCNDQNGDIIPELTCYEVIECSTIFTFLNDYRCEEYMK